MNSKKQILIIGFTFLAVFSILFLIIRAEYGNDHKTTSLEIEGVNDITDIYNLAISLKSLRGMAQLKAKDSKLLKSSLFVDEDAIFKSIKRLKDKEIEDFYTNIKANQDRVSKMETFTQYTKLLKSLHNRKSDIADSSHLLFEADRNIYFLITTSILDVPSITESTGKIRGLGIRVLDNNDNNDIKFVLDANIHAFRGRIEDIQYKINKLSPNDKNKLNSLLSSVVSDFYTVNAIVKKVKERESDLTAKEYFLEVSKLVNKIYDFYAKSTEILTSKLADRKAALEYKLLLMTIFYILLMSTLLLTIFYAYRKSDKDENIGVIKKKHNKFIEKLHNEYRPDANLKQVCSKSLKSLMDYFDPLNGSIYLFDEQNKKLYLGATYGIKHNDLNQTLDINENFISENILEKKIKIIDINKEVDVGNLKVKGRKLVTIPIMEFEKSIGTVQLTFDNKFDKIDLEFLQSVVSLMGTYIYKAQIDEKSEKYIKLIDKHVLISKTDLHGNIIEVSDHLCNLSQYSKEELLSGVTHRIFKHKDMDKEIFVDIWRTITKGNIWRGEIKNRKKDGNHYWVYSNIAPDFDINGNIVGYVALRTDITDKKKIEEIAITDGLTSLYNRRHFDNIFPQQIEVTKRAKDLLAFVLIDIDHFKQYNDTYGHQDGDTTLKLVAKELKETLKRPDDYTFRLGGEEFGLVYHIDNEDDALLIANIARENIENLKIEHSGNSASKFVTISSGIYIVKEEDNSSIDEIYKKTDEALYVAKQSGRNQVSAVMH